MGLISTMLTHLLYFAAISVGISEAQTVSRGHTIPGFPCLQLHTVCFVRHTDPIFSARADPGHIWAGYWRLRCDHHSLRKLRCRLTAADLCCPIAWATRTQRDLQAHCQRRLHIHAWPLWTVLLLSHPRYPQYAVLSSYTHAHTGAVSHGAQQHAAPSKIWILLLPREWGRFQSREDHHALVPYSNSH